jgi:hypothetical protein
MIEERQSTESNTRNSVERGHGGRSLALMLVGFAVVLAALALDARRERGPTLEPPF